jgi:DMSO/TMAO reductase YedYZ heme-binding membrane subunit
MTDQLLWFATRGAGIVSLLFLTGVVYLGILGVLRWQTPAWPRFATTGFHRNLALLSVAFLAVHIVTAVIDPFASLGPLAAVLPFASSYRPPWVGLGVLALDLGAAIVITSLLKGRLGRRTWRAVHWLSYAAWPLAVLHGIGAGTDTTAPWMLAIYAACVAIVGAAVLVRVTAGRSRGPATPIMAGMQRTPGARQTARPAANP